MLFAAATLYLISMLLLSRITELWHLLPILRRIPFPDTVIGYGAPDGLHKRMVQGRLGLGIGILWAAGGIGTAAFAPLAG